MILRVQGLFRGDDGDDFGEAARSIKASLFGLLEVDDAVNRSVDGVITGNLDVSAGEH